MFIFSCFSTIIIKKWSVEAIARTLPYFTVLYRSLPQLLFQVRDTANISQE